MRALDRARPPPRTAGGPRGRARRVDALARQALPDASFQDAIVGGAVSVLAGAAFVANARGDPAPCALCAGTGGCTCFACTGSGGTGGASAADVARAAAAEGARPPTRDFIGRTPPPAGECRVCAGSGLVLCSKCGGSGYS
jgi:hypothetical protein